MSATPHKQLPSDASAWQPRRPHDDDQSRKLWTMSAAEQAAAMQAGRLTLRQCFELARKAPERVPLLNGEYWFIAIATPEVAEASGDAGMAPT